MRRFSTNSNATLVASKWAVFENLGLGAPKLDHKKLSGHLVTAYRLLGFVDNAYIKRNNLQNPKPGYPPLTHLLFMRGLETVLAEEQGAEREAADGARAARSRGRGWGARSS